jgi:hypothetical protein
MPVKSRKIFSQRRWRLRASRLAQKPLVRLIRHFLARLVHGGQDEGSEFSLGAGALLGLLAAPGAFQTFVMINKYSTLLDFVLHRHRDYYLSSIPDKYLFLSIAMAVTGIVTVLKWDRILPDAQDYANLAPLPIRARTILAANVAAIGIAVLLFVVVANAFSTVLFPAFVTAAAGRPAGVSAVRGHPCRRAGPGMPVYLLRGLHHSGSFRDGVATAPLPGCIVLVARQHGRCFPDAAAQRRGGAVAAPTAGTAAGFTAPLAAPVLVPRSLPESAT